MKIFKNYAFSWRQMGVFKVCLLSIGVILGSYWPEFFQENIKIVFAIAVVATIYILYISLRQ